MNRLDVGKTDGQIDILVLDFSKCYVARPKMEVVLSQLEGSSWLIKSRVLDPFYLLDLDGYSRDCILKSDIDVALQAHRTGS